MNTKECVNLIDREMCTRERERILFMTINDQSNIRFENLINYITKFNHVLKIYKIFD